MKVLYRHLALATLALTPLAYAQEQLSTTPYPEGSAEAAEPGTVVTEETTITEVTETQEAPSAPPPAQVSDYVGALGHYYWLDDDWGADNGTGVHILRGWNLKGRWYLEGSLYTNVFETDVDDATDYYQHGVGVDLVYAFGDRNHFTPFVLLGGSGAYNDVVPDREDEWSGVANAGLGFVTGPLTQYGLRVRAEGRYLWNSFQDEYTDYRAGLGLELPLVKAETMTALAPTEEKVRVVSTEIADSDGDGVADPYDACPDTPRGMEVDGRGCALPQVLTLTGVVFEFDSARLTSDGRKILDDVSKKIIAYKDIPMELAGHTDNVGPDDYNQKLSDLRANAVRDYLVEQGVKGDKLVAKGYGESQPTADNETDAGRQLNRRVELRIEGQK